MTVNQAVDLLVYGLLVVGLSLAAHGIAPDFAGKMLPWVITGGLLTMILGLLGLRGWCRRSWAAVSLVVVAGLMIAQLVMARIAASSGTSDLKLVAVIYILLLFFAVMQLVDFGRTMRGRLAKDEIDHHDSEAARNNSKQCRQRPDEQ